MKKIISNAKYIWDKLKRNPLATLWCYIPAQLIGKSGYPLLVMPFRGWARNRVYNYVLQNENRDWLNRLWEREPFGGVTGYHLFSEENPVHGNQLDRNGFIKYRKVSKLQFWLVVLFLWQWLDDDSNEDTTDWGHIERNFPSVLEDIFRPVYGNTFDLGDVRAEHTFFNFKAWWLWNWRNTAMNAKYLWLNY